MRSSSKQWISVALWIVGLTATTGLKTASAVQLDWSGQFWFQNHWLNNYQLDRARPGYDADRILSNNGSAYVPGTGEKNVVWYDAFLRLRPKMVVNDSLFIKSDLFVGSPRFNFIGRSYPSNGDERFNFTGSQRDSLTIGAQRYWASLITDFGTLEVGRAPRHWALGALWDAGDDLFDRFQSTGDMVRLVSKFGNFSIQPALIKVAVGNNVAGATDASGNVVQGNDDVTDYELAVKYDNSEEDFEFGMMWTKRTGNAAQRTVFFNPSQAGSTRINFNMFDFYARKKWGRFFFGGELPLINGDIGAVDGRNEFEYKTFAVIFEGGYTSDIWDIGLKAGHVPGQKPDSPGDNKFRAVYLNRDYKLGLLMFNYNLYGLTNNNPDNVASSAVTSPYDAGLVNANYVALNPELKLDKWTVKGTFVAAFADQVAKSGQRFYNHERRQFFNAANNQSKFMGVETDLGVSFKWDENIIIAWDLGVWFPGSYFEFSNTVDDRRLNSDTFFGSQARIGVTF